MIFAPLCDSQSGSGIMTEVSSRYRQLGPAGRIITRVLLCSLPVLSVIFVLDIPLYFGTSFFAEQYYGVFLALFLTAVFLRVPATKGASRSRLPWYDGLFILLSLIAGGYIAVRYPAISKGLGSIYAPHVVLGAIMVILLLEATRRVTGWALLSLAIVFILYTRYNNFIPGLLGGSGFEWKRIFSYLYLDTSAILGMALAVVPAIVIPFILFGQALFSTGGGKVLTDFALSILGWSRGGPAKVAVLASCLFGTMSGSAAANVAVTGVVTIPLMKKIGYKPHVAGSIEAVASTGGNIMPPVMGSVAFLISQFLSIPYSAVCIAAAVPAIAYYLVTFIQVDLEAAKSGLKGLPREMLPPLKKTLLASWILLVPMAILIFFLFVLSYNAAVAALYSLVGVVVVSMLRKETRLTPRKVLEIIEGTGRSVVDVGIVCAVAGIIIGTVGLTSLGFILSHIIINMAGGNLFLILLMSAVVCTILGMGVPVAASYILVIVLSAPALIASGMDPLAAHMFVFYFAVLSFLTPPVCIAVYVAASIAQSDVMKTALQSMKLGIVAYLVPFFFAYSPALLLKGPVSEIMVVVPSALLGFVFLAIAFQGYLFKKMSAPSRGVLLVGSLMLAVPTGSFGLGISNIVGSLVGLGIAAVVVLWEWTTRRRRVAVGVAPQKAT